MSYTRKPKVFRVRFEDPHPLAGLEVVTKGLSVKEFAAFGLRLGEVAQIEAAGTDAEKLTELKDVIEAIDDVRELFADALISWDMLEEDGTPTPATLDGVRGLDDEEFFGIVNEWLAAIGGPTPDLGKDSGPGGTIPELSGLMEPRSPSLVS